jgi:hypothetical protein
MKLLDIIVVGGGISGAMAAIAAGRDGAEVLLIEQYGYAGGMLTAAGVGPMMTFHAGEKQVIKGLVGELADRLIKKGKSPGHILDTGGCTATLTPFDAEAMKRELDIMLKEAGVKLLFHTMLAQVHVGGSEIRKIIVCNKAGLCEFSAKFYVDATGDADLSAWAGVPFTKGRNGDGKCQPMTLKFRMVNVNVDKIREYIRNNPEDFPYLKGDTSHIGKAPRLSIGGFTGIVRAAKTKKQFNIPRESILIFEGNNPGEVIVNTSRIQDHDGTDPFSITDAELLGREQVEELVNLLKSAVPGFGDSMLVYSGPNIGVRSSRQIKGVYTLTREDVLNFRKFDDAIACSAYPIDVHPPEGSKLENQSDHFRKGDYYTIPYRCLVNEKIGNLITAGRCLSAEFEAQAAIRTTPTVGAIGHAAGLAASIAATKGIAGCNIKYKELREIGRAFV